MFCIVFLFMEFYLKQGQKSSYFPRVVKITIPEPELLRLWTGKKYEVIRLRKIRQSKYKQRRGRAALPIAENGSEKQIPELICLLRKSKRK